MFSNFFSRRAFLKASLSGALLLCGRKQAFSRALSQEGMPEGRLSFFNTHNREQLTVTYRTPEGEYDPEAIKAINWILRCHFTNEFTDMDLRTIEYLNMVDKKLGGGNEIHIISGYRSPRYNGLLRSEGRGVAKHSLHMSGMAIDISIPGIGLADVRHAALNLRRGGVGYYPGGGFVHIDSGVFRSW